MQGKFITIEGTEGAGKSTALKFIKDYFAQLNKKIVLTREPGGTPLAEEIRQVLLHPNSSETMSSETELLLMFAARAQHIHHTILPALKTGSWVISDRYIDATYAYQGAGRNINLEQINILDKLVVKQLYPDLTLLLDVPAEVGMKRAEKRGSEKDRIEQEQMDFFVRVRNEYLTRAKEDPKRIKVIDASQSLASVQNQLQQVLDEFVKSVAA